MKDGTFFILVLILYTTRKHRNAPEEEYKFKLADWMLENEI
jgi:hypothetical protein